MDPARARQYCRIGEFELDLSSGELRRNGHKSRLPEQPLQILLLLLERRDRVVSRDDLRQRLWPADTFVDFEMGLNRAVRKLRDALGDSADNPQYIETVPRRGYRLIADVSDPVPAVAAPATRKWIGGAAALAIVAVLAILAVVAFSRAKPPAIHSVAVLPFANLSSDRSQEYFADGITEALITDLAQLRDVTVISRTSVMRYKASRRPLPEIARELHVDGVIEGGVLRAGGRVRVTVQLIHAATDHHLWAHSYERSESDIVTLQRELAESITDALRAELTPAARNRIRTARPVDPAAYELFLKGTAAAGKGTTQGFTEAIAYLTDAIEKQPDFARAHVQLAECYTQFAWNGAVAPHEFMPKAKAAVLAALAIDPGLAVAHAEMGRILYQYDWDWAGSEREFRRAIELGPNDAATHRGYAALLRTTGRNESAEREAARVRELDPFSGKTQNAVLGAGLALRSKKNYEKAIGEMRRALQMDPALPRGHFQLGMTLMEAGKRDEGVSELETAVRLSQKNRRFQASVGWAYALAGRDKDARRVLGELESRARREYVSPVAIALVHLALHEKEPALQWLERAYEQRDFDLILANTSSQFEVLRKEPRFRELMRRIGLPEA